MRYLPLLFCALCGIATAATYEKSIDVIFPEEIAHLTFSGRSVFQQKELGVNLSWQRSGPVRATAYIYNGGATDIPAELDSFAVKNHFARLLNEAAKLEKLGKVRALGPTPEQEQISHFEGCGPQFLWREFEMVVPEGSATSSLWLTTVKGQFVKLRLQYPKGDEKGQQDTKLFVAQIRKLLGNCKD
jgi:hypothetical protein